MSKIKNNAEVQTYDESSTKKLFVKSHWNKKDFVEITIGKETVIIVGRDLQQAITNCMNVGF